MGAGAEMRRALGTAVFSGMLGVTIFGLLLTPVFFNIVDSLGRTGLFRSRPMRMISNVFMFVITLGIPWSMRRIQQRRADQDTAEEDDITEP